MIKLTIIDVDKYNLYWSKYRKQTRFAFEKYYEYVNAGNTIKSGFVPESLNTPCKELFGVTYTTLFKHSTRLQKLGIIKRERVIKNLLSKIEENEKTDLRIKIRSNLTKLNLSTLKELLNIISLSSKKSK